MGQSWLDLLFLHWPVPADLLRQHVPSALQLDENTMTPSEFELDSEPRAQYAARQDVLIWRPKVASR